MTAIIILGIAAILSAPAIIWLKTRRRHYVEIRPKTRGEK